MARLSPLYAEVISAENASRTRVGGPDAIGGLGDWAFGNGVLCAVVSDPSHESILSARGGVLVDLGHCGLADDQWNALQPVFNISQEDVPPVQQVSALVAEREARIVTQGAFGGMVFTTTYSLGLDDPEALRIHTSLRRVDESGAVRLLGDIALHGTGSMAPFTASTRDPAVSLGFQHPAVDPFRPIELLRGIVPADLHVIVGGDALEPGIAYGLRLLRAERQAADGATETLPWLSINGVDFTLLGVLAEPYWFGGDSDIGPLELAQIFFMDVEVGDTLTFERELRVGRRADVASVTDALWAHEPLVTGRVDDAGARIHVSRSDGSPLTQVRPAADGRFAFRAPPGALRLHVRAPAGRELLREVMLTNEGVEIEPIVLGDAPKLKLPRGNAMRLAFAPSDGTPKPRFGDELLGFRVGKRVHTSRLSGDISLAGVRGDPRTASLGAGSYTVYASRGPEFGIEAVALDIAEGTTSELTLDLAPPQRALETPGWMSADLHIHSLSSDDSSLPLDERIRTLVAAGLEIAVSTEHDVVTDYGPAIRELGVGNQVASVIGIEVTSTSKEKTSPHTAGHLNALPVPHRPLEYRGGALDGEGIRIRDLAAQLRELPGRRILQLNHPRGSSSSGGAGQYFTHLTVVGEAFDPAKPLTAQPNAAAIEKDAVTGLRDLDFDAVELWNGPSMLRYYVTRADWFSLLLQGEVRTATANSDSHRFGEILGMPRNMLRVPFDTPGEFDESAFVDAVRAGRLYGTSGPLLDVRLDTAELGDTFQGRSGTLRIGVSAAPWVPVSRARVFVDAIEVHSAAVEAGATLEVPLSFARDAFVTVEVEGETTGDAARAFRAINPKFASFAFTNPIFVDADGDGHWTARGLPADLPRTIGDPASYAPAEAE